MFVCFLTTPITTLFTSNSLLQVSPLNLDSGEFILIGWDPVHVVYILWVINVDNFSCFFLFSVFCKWGCKIKCSHRDGNGDVIVNHLHVIVILSVFTIGKRHVTHYVIWELLRLGFESCDDPNSLGSFSIYFFILFF